jgi:hypothetical protein
VDVPSITNSDSPTFAADAADIVAEIELASGAMPDDNDPATLSIPASTEGGKGGDTPTSPPPLPPLAAPQTRTPSREAAIPRGDDVFTPAPIENPVLVALKDKGLYGRQLAPGRHRITCPWSHEHNDEAQSDAIYYGPNATHPVGGFHCEHPHADADIGQLLVHLGVKPESARCKAMIRSVAGELPRVLAAAERVLAAKGEYYQASGVVVCLKTNPTSGDISVEPVNEPALTKALSAAADWERYDARAKAWLRCDPIPRIVQMLLRGQSFDLLPVLDGLARQPFFRKVDGVLVTTPGYDPISKFYAAFDPAEFPLPEPTEAAARAALAELNALIGEFRFDSSIDRATTLSAMFTATVRPSLPVAPAFNITASASGSGKSYLASALAMFAGAGEPMNVSYPATSEEATKAMLSVLMTKPAVVLFDDLQHDWKAHGVMNRMLTSETISDRILGASRTGTVSTATFFMGTGNNIEPLQDMRRRVCTIALNARTASPATIRYTGSPVEAVSNRRGHHVGLVLTIIQAWQAAGCPKADVLSIATFGGEWADYCRHPLIWLGEKDPATSLIEQPLTDSTSETLGHLMAAWYDELRGKAVTVRKLVETAEAKTSGPLYEALTDLPVMERTEVNRGKLGWILKKNENRVINGLQIRKAPCSERTAWAVVPIIDEADSVQAPPLPPLTGAVV